MSETSEMLSVESLVELNKNLTNKIKLLLKEINNHNLYTINLEKKIIDLEFQNNQLKLNSPLKLNYEEKYKQIIKILQQVKEHNSFCVENNLSWPEDNSFVKIIELFEKIEEKRNQNLLEEAKNEIFEKNLLIEDLNKILLKNEQNFIIKTEQMKNQINYLIGLLNVQYQEERNKNLLEVIKISTNKNNELIGKDENHLLKEEIKNKQNFIEILLKSNKEYEMHKIQNEEIKKVNEEIFVSLRNTELVAKEKSLEIENLLKIKTVLEEHIDYLKMENESLFLKNKSLTKISENFYEKQKEIENKENEILKNQIKMKEKAKLIKENKKFLKKKKLKIKKLKIEQNKKESENKKIKEENKNLKEINDNLQNEFNIKINEINLNYKIEFDKLIEDNKMKEEKIKDQEKVINDFLRNTKDSTLEILGKEKFLLNEENTKLYKKIEELKSKLQFYMERNEISANENEEKYKIEINNLNNELILKNKIINELKEKEGSSELINQLKEKDNLIMKLNSSIDKLKEAFLKLKESKNN